MGYMTLSSGTPREVEYVEEKENDTAGTAENAVSNSVSLASRAEAKPPSATLRRVSEMAPRDLAFTLLDHSTPAFSISPIAP
jgi:hypothetical protein